MDNNYPIAGHLKGADGSDDTTIEWVGTKGPPDQNESDQTIYKTNNEAGDIVQSGDIVQEQSMTFWTDYSVVITHSEPIAAEDVDDFFAGTWNSEEDTGISVLLDTMNQPRHQKMKDGRDL